MKNKATTKTIMGIIILVFVVSFYTPITSNAATQTMSDLYSNPNQISTKDQFRFTAAQVLRSGIIQNVIGCTGVVNKVAGWMVSFVQSPAKQAEITMQKAIQIKKQLKDSCKAIKAGGEAASGSIINTMLVKTLDTTFEKFCAETVETEPTPKQAEALVKTYEEERNNNIKEQCFDGIAITLAKNQLTSMTRSVMNWANTGYGGNPFFVQNVNSLNNNIQKNILENSVSQLTSGGSYPYGSDFSRSLIRSYNSGFTKYGATNIWDSLTSDLSSFISDDEYSNTGTYGIGGTTDSTIGGMDALQRAQWANNRFANDFSTGGWDGWLALTQRDQNNPLGFTMIASQYVADQISNEITKTEEEVSQNNGFLNQKECIKWINYDTKTQKPLINPKYTEWQRQSLGLSFGSSSKDGTIPSQFVYSKNKKTEYDRCAPDGWKTVTPGSLIKEKVTNYLNSPERQLELADTINESLNALFSVLISKLEEGGLAGLSDATTSVNWTDDINDFSNVIDGTSPYNNNGAYGNFNITKDLGNMYIHDKTYNLGSWNAKTNKTTGPISVSLYPGISPTSSVKDGSGNYITSNLYYTVTTAGKTKLITGGYNNWEVGDRAFWDGTEWQNWKCGAKNINVEQECSAIRTDCINYMHDENLCQSQYYTCLQEKARGNGACTNQTSPIKKRGVIQIQKDYIVAAKEILGVLPNVMPKLGELDYCIPGPNPSYKTNSTDAQGAYQDWIGSLYVGLKDQYRTVMSIDHPGDRTYNNFASIYDDSQNVWDYIKNTFIVKWLLSNFNTYHYDKNGNYPSSEEQDIKDHTELADLNINYASNHQFQNFYEAFDKMMDKFYFKKMTSKYLEVENRSLNIDTDKNPAYVPMAESGLELTGNILYYNDEITTATEEYKNAIKEASTNISKLEPIKAEVSGIIKAAQDRRDAKILEQIKKDKCDTAYAQCIDQIKINDINTNMTFLFTKKALAEDQTSCEVQYETCMNTPVSQADKLAYKTKYAACLEEENVQFYDPEEIMGMGSIDEERCTNDIDDDLDGLIDSKDPDCGGTTTTDRYSCVATTDHSFDVYLSDFDCSDGKCHGAVLPSHYMPMPCEARPQENICEATEFLYFGPVPYAGGFLGTDPYNNYRSRTCDWVKIVN